MKGNLFWQKNFIGGEWLDKKEKISVFNPADQSLIGKVPSCDGEDVKSVITVAKNAFDKWKKLAGKERAKILKNWYELILKNQENLLPNLSRFN